MWRMCWVWLNNHYNFCVLDNSVQQAPFELIIISAKVYNQMCCSSYKIAPMGFNYGAYLALVLMCGWHQALSQWKTDWRRFGAFEKVCSESYLPLFLKWLPCQKQKTLYWSRSMYNLFQRFLPYFVIFIDLDLINISDQKVYKCYLLLFLLELYYLSLVICKTVVYHRWSIKFGGAQSMSSVWIYKSMEWASKQPMLLLPI